jgi:hypothetical protein
MPFLMHIGFDNPMRLKRRVYYLQYGGVRFKLVQNDGLTQSDILLTLIPAHDPIAQQHAYAVGTEFLSALGWINGSPVAVQNIGGIGVRSPFRLREARVQMWASPQVPFGRYSVNHDIFRIPQVETADQRTALHLFREALSSNKQFLSFLFYWQILEVGGGNAVDWADKVHRRRYPKLHLPSDQVRQLPLGTRSLGSYLQGDWRDAIAHIRRQPGKKILQFDVSTEARLLGASTTVVQRLAQHYIRERLGLKKLMYLARKWGKGFPTFVPEDEFTRGPYKTAYYP